MTAKRLPGPVHRIAGIAYRPLAADSECTCGERFAATSPEALAEQWTGHRAAVGAGRAADMGNEHIGRQRMARVKPRLGNLRGDAR